MSLPKISVITPSYNQGRFIEETILSVIDQNYPNLEYIILDGASNDNSVEIITKYEKSISFWESQKDNGQADAINKGFRRATGEVVAWLNSDDFYYSDALHTIANLYLENPKAGLYVGNGAVADINGKHLRPYSRGLRFDYNALLRGSNYILQPSTFINSRVFSELGYLDEKYVYCLDYEYWLRVASNYDVVTVDKELSAFRWYETIKTATGGIARWVEQWEIVREYANEQMTPGLLVELFNVLKEKEVQDDIGFDISEFALSSWKYFYDRMQSNVNTHSCIPKYSTMVNCNEQGPLSPEIDKENKIININKTVGSKPRIDIVMPVGHSWFVREGYASALKHLGCLAREFYVDPKSKNQELFEYIHNPQADVIFLMNTDWHCRNIHGPDWCMLWKKIRARKVLFSFECMNNPVIRRSEPWHRDTINAVDNAMQCIDAVVFAHEPDNSLFARYGLPALWQPFAIDEEIFPEPSSFGKRLKKAFFKGKIDDFYNVKPYDNREKLIAYLKQSTYIDIADSYCWQTGSSIDRAKKFINEMNQYQIILSLPSMSPTMVVRPFEAMAAGAVAFQPNIVGARTNRLFKDGHNIVMYDPSDFVGLIQRIEQMLKNADLSDEIALHGRQEILAKHTIKHRVRQVIDWIDNIDSMQNENATKPDLRSHF